MCNDFQATSFRLRVLWSHHKGGKEISVQKDFASFRARLEKERVMSKEAFKRPVGRPKNEH